MLTPAVGHTKKEEAPSSPSREPKKKVVLKSAEEVLRCQPARLTLPTVSKVKVLYLFSGPSNKDGTLKKALAELV